MFSVSKKDPHIHTYIHKLEKSYSLLSFVTMAKRKSPTAGATAAKGQNPAHNLIAVAVLFLTVAVLVSQLVSTPDRAPSPAPLPAAPAETHGSAQQVGSEEPEAIGNEELDSMFNHLDANGDGKISHIEYFKRARTIIVDPNVDLTDMWLAEDANGDGFISRREFGQGQQDPSTTHSAGYDDFSSSQPTGEVSPEGIMQRLDRNQDGRLSLQEFEESYEAEGMAPDTAMWQATDTNGDGFVDLGELDASLEQERQRAAAAGGADQGYGYGNADQGYGYGDADQGRGYGQGGSRDARSPKVSMEAKVRRRGAGGFGMDDVAVDDFAQENADGYYQQQQQQQQQPQQHQAAQAPNVEQVFDQYDTDLDGRITPDEFFAVSGRSDEAQLGFDHADRNGDQLVSFEELQIAMEMSGEMDNGSGGGGGGGGPEQEAARIMRMVDTNEDGFITLAELVKMQGGDEELAQNMFREADYNYDERISLQELQDTLEQQAQGQAPQGQGQPQQGNVRGSEQDDEPNIFAAIDSNHDGVISKEEFWATEGSSNPDAEALWAGDDHNQDGFIEWTEFSGPKGEQEPAVTNQEFNSGSDRRSAGFGGGGGGGGGGGAAAGSSAGGRRNHRRGSSAAGGGDAGAVYMKHK